MEFIGQVFCSELNAVAGDWDCCKLLVNHSFESYHDSQCTRNKNFTLFLGFELVSKQTTFFSITQCGMDNIIMNV